MRWVTDKTAGVATSSLEDSPADEVIDGSIRFLYAPPTGSKIKEKLQQSQNRVRALGSQKDSSAEKLYGLAEGYQILSYLSSLWVFETAPDSYRAHQLKGQYYEALDKDEEAIKEYRRALELKPELQNMHFSIGTLYWKRERFEEALPKLQYELELNPNHPQALYEIGDILYAQGKSDVTEKYFLKALSFDPAMAEAHLGVERIYSAKGQYDRALGHLRKITEISPEDPTPHYRMSAIYQKLGRLAESQKEMEIFKQLKAQESKR